MTLRPINQLQEWILSFFVRIKEQIVNEARRPSNNATIVRRIFCQIWDDQLESACADQVYDLNPWCVQTSSGNQGGKKARDKNSFNWNGSWCYYYVDNALSSIAKWKHDFGRWLMECLPFFLSNPGTQYSKSGEGDFKKGKADHKKGERQLKDNKNTNRSM